MAQLLLANPRKRRKTRAVSKIRRRTRRNPIRLGGITDSVTKGAIGAAGALAVDVAMTRLPIPANLQFGAMGAATRAAVGIGLGMLVAKFGRNKRLGAQLAEGALTVGIYNLGKSMLPGAVPPDMGDPYLLGSAWMDTNDMGYLSPAGYPQGTVDPAAMMGDAYIDTNY